MTTIRRRPRDGSKRKECGYMLLFLMLAVAILTITMIGVAANYRRSIIRDREVEMIHRGEQYERAVRRFYIKNGRYPVSLEQLENMNKIRYLRKRYKDPMSPDGQWKIVHPTDIKLTGAATQPTTAGVATAANATSATNPTSAAQPAQDSSAASANQGTNTGNTSGTDTPSAGTTSSTGAGDNSGNASGSSTSTSSAGGTASGGNNPTQSGSVLGNSAGANNAANGQVLGGGDVYGVVSKSKAKGFHIFGEKEKYSEWFFIYDPTMDKGQLMVGPYNPKMFIGSANSGLNSGKGTSGTGTGTSTGSGSQASPSTQSGSSSSTTTQQTTSQSTQ